MTKIRKLIKNIIIIYILYFAFNFVGFVFSHLDIEPVYDHIDITREYDMKTDLIIIEDIHGEKIEITDKPSLSTIFIRFASAPYARIQTKKLWNSYIEIGVLNVKPSFLEADSRKTIFTFNDFCKITVFGGFKEYDYFCIEYRGEKKYKTVYKGFYNGLVGLFAGLKTYENNETTSIY